MLCTELVIELYRRHCPGCIDGKRASINHLCHQTSLLGKFEAKYDMVVKKMALNMVQVVNRFVSIYPEFTAQEEGVITTATNFLLCSTAKSIYFGGYTEDEIFCTRMLDAFEKNPSLIRMEQADNIHKSGGLKRTTDASKSSVKKSKKSSVENVLSKAYDDFE